MSTTEAFISHDDQARQFCVALSDNLSGLVRYDWREGAEGQPRVMRLMHTFVPPQLQGQGQGGVLMEAVLAEAAAMGVLVEPVCSYTQTYLTRHAARWGHLLAPRV